MLRLHAVCLIVLAVLAFVPGSSLRGGDASVDAKPRFAIILHGGAGVPERLTDPERRAYEKSLKQALEVGRTILAGGGTSLDAVEQTIRTMEDDPLFNAGRGAVFNHDGRHELDASIMEGRKRQAGAVAGVRTVKNPISLARLVMTETRHVLLVADGAEKFADEMQDRPQIERVTNDYFSTPERRRDLEKAWQKARDKQPAKPHMGTVGCVALDEQGNLAAGTSTGGLTDKKFGRVGDSPIIGAGTYAENATCGVSCTGTGEYFIRASAAFHVSALMKYKELPLDEAVRHVIERILEPDTGGMIALDARGRVSARTNTAGLARAWIDGEGKTSVALGQ